MQTKSAPVFRFKNSSELNDILERFAMIHCNDTDYKEFNEAWDVFYDNNTEIIDNDHKRHIELGFKATLKKLYTSVRYYHCKRFALGKTDDRIDTNLKKQNNKEKRTYKKVDDSILEAIDLFLEEKITITTKPAAAYTNFCEEHGDDFFEKKTFKNRFYNYMKNFKK